MDIEEQLKKWEEGQSLHNEERGECCPDFSCCQPNLLAPSHERQAFAKAYREEGSDSPIVQSMLMGFLTRMIGNQTYVAGNTSDTIN